MATAADVERTLTRFVAAYRAAENVRAGKAWDEKRWQAELLEHLGRDVTDERRLRQVLGLEGAGLIWARDRRVDFVVGLDGRQVPVELKLLKSSTSRPDVMSLVFQGIAWSAALGGALLVVIDTSDAGVTPSPEESAFVHTLADAGIAMLWCREGTAVRIEHVTAPGRWQPHDEDREREHLADRLAAAVAESRSKLTRNEALVDVLRGRAAELGQVELAKATKNRLFGVAPGTGHLLLRSRTGRRFAIFGQVVMPDTDDADGLLQCAMASTHLHEQLDGSVVVALNRKPSKKAAVHMEQARRDDIGTRLARVHYDLGIDWRLVNASNPDDIIRLPGVLPLARDIPRPQARQGRLDDFGQTFFGYEFWRESSSEANAERSAHIREEVREQYASTGSVGDNLARIRTALFSEQRAAHHVGYPLSERDAFVHALMDALRASASP